MAGKRNSKPEKILEKEILHFLRLNGFDVDVVESKAVFSQKLGRYLNSQTTVGMSDLIGNDKNGHACFIELKAKGRRSTLSQRQKLFLMKKIDSNAFACVVDSVEMLSQIYQDWKHYKASTDYEARQFLLNMLP